MKSAIKISILGIDPGSLKTGFGLVEFCDGEIKHINHGVILLGDKVDLPQRLLALSDSLQMLLKKYSPDHVVIEQMFLGKNPDSAFKLGHARGVALAESIRVGATLYEYATRLVKKIVAGTGGASKDQVQTSLQHQLKLGKLVNYDASDALALAVCHCHQIVASAQLEKLRE